MAHGDLDGRDVTGALDVPKLLLEATEAFPRGLEDPWLIAASASHKVLAAFGAAPNAGHATAVNGNPGGYPVSFTNGIAELDLPPGVSVEDAVKVNLEGQRRDGIAEIRSVGEAVLAAHATAVMRDVLGWEDTSYRVEG